jgi:hypothetical protein
MIWTCPEPVSPEYTPVPPSIVYSPSNCGRPPVVAGQVVELTLELTGQIKRSSMLANLLDPVELLIVEDDQAGRLARRADQFALVVAERLHKLAAQRALVPGPVGAWTQRGVVVRRLVQPLALASVVVVARGLVPVRAVGAGVDEPEVPRSDPAGADGDS